MRLVCPNCGAQYEVDDRVIPEGGRDVQCSNCGHTWFQRPAGHEAEAQHAEVQPAQTPEPQQPGENEPPDEGAPAPAQEDVEADHARPAKAQAEVEPEEEIDIGTEAEIEAEREPEIEETLGEELGEEEPAGLPEAAARRALDENLGAVLRQEAEREAKAREHERQQIETQEELGLEHGEPAAVAAVAAQERMARLRGLDTEEEVTAEAGARRDLLPDIDEINSSLTSIGSEEVVDEFAEPAKRSSFGRGFMLVLLLALIVVALYLYAPVISQKLPALAGSMDAYVGLIDRARDWVDALVAAAISKLQG